MALTKVRQEQGVVINEGSTDVDLRVESNGNANMLFVDGGNDKIGINNGSPARQLHITDTIANGGASLGLTSSDSSTTGAMGILHFGNNTDSSLASIGAIADGSTSAGALLFKTEVAGGAIEERMRITSTGGVIITTADSTDQLTLTSTLADANVAPNLRMYRNSASPADNDQLGKIQYEGRNDNNQDVIYSEVVNQIKDASDGTEDGRMAFNVMVGGTSTSRVDMQATETVINNDSVDLDFRVESNGNQNMLFVDGGNNFVTFGSVSTDPIGDASSSVAINASGNIGINKSGAVGLDIGRTSSDGAVVGFYRSTSQVGTISVTASNTAYNTSSDYRLKENVDYIWDATTRLKQLKPARFNFISDETNNLVDGFLAHEVSSVVPEAITGTKDAVDEDGAAVMQHIDHSFLVPLLVKTIQELEARLTAGGL